MDEHDLSGTTRDYWVYVPKQYAAARPACVMVFQDGQWYVKEDGDWRVPIVFAFAWRSGSSTNLLFFTKGQPTERVWYYDLSDIKVGKKAPLTVGHFEEFFRLLPERAESDHSWTVERSAIEAKNFDVKAVNPNARTNQDTRTPEELLDIIEAKGREVSQAVAQLRGLTSPRGDKDRP